MDLRQDNLDETPSLVDADSSSEEDPDWLRRIRERRKAETEPEDVTTEEAVDELPTGALRSSHEQIEPLGFSPASVPLPDSENDIPDWLSGLGDSAVEDEPEGLPDWLSGGASASRSAGPETELPEWLSGSRKEMLHGPAGEPEISGEPLEPATSPLKDAALSEDILPDSEIPSWLAGFVTGETPSADQSSADEERPGWLSDLEKSATLDVTPSQQPEAQPANLDWLETRGVQPESLPDQKETRGQDGDVKSVSPFTFDEEGAGFNTEDLPDWLKGVSAQEISEET